MHLSVLTFTGDLYFIIQIQVTVWCSFFSAHSTPFSISCRAALIARNPLRFYLSGNIFISPLFLKDGFARYRIIGWRYYYLSTLNSHPIAFWPLWFLLRIGCYFYWGSFDLEEERFFFAALKILPAFVFRQFHSTVLVWASTFIPLGVHRDSGFANSCLCSNFGCIWPLFLQICLLLLSSGTLIIHMLVCLLVSLQFLRLYSLFFFLFSF